MEVCFVHIFIFILKNIIAHKIDSLTHEELFGTGQSSNENHVSFVVLTTFILYKLINN